VREGEALVEFAGRRDRNLLELNARQRRVDSLLDDLDGFVTRFGVPARFDVAWEDYRSGSVNVRLGIDESRRAFGRFDWDVLAAATNGSRGAWRRSSDR
jgi:hypothetical protein